MDDQYEAFDSHYTVEISRKMRVPDRLSVGPNPINLSSHNGPSVNGTSEPDNPNKIIHDMAVPEKIVVGGHNQHLALKPEPRPLADILTVATASASGAAGMALSESQQPSFVALPTPPRTLTVDTYIEKPQNNNTVDDEEEDSQNEKRQRKYSGTETPPGRTRRSDSQLSAAAFSGCEDDDTKLRRQMVRLSRRVDWLEDENRRRSNRDLFYGTLIFGYVVFKVVAWLVKLPR